MDLENIAVRVVLGIIVGIGFVAPTVRAVVDFAGFGSAFATLLGILCGVGVMVLFAVKGRRVR